MANSTSKNFMVTLEDWFKKAPALPTDFKEGVVRVAPVLVLIFGIIGVVFGIAGTGFLAFLTPLALLLGVNGYGGGIIAGLTLLITSALLLASYKGVKSRKLSGWTLLFWSVVVNIVGSVISYSLGGAILGFLVGFYLLFQIKSYYK